jgi:hypothetical protein
MKTKEDQLGQDHYSKTMPNTVMVCYKHLTLEERRWKMT